MKDLLRGIGVIWFIICSINFIPKIIFGNFNLQNHGGVAALLGTIIGYLLVASPGIFAIKSLFFPKRKLSPFDYKFHCQLGEMAVKDGKIIEAIEHFKQAVFSLQNNYKSLQAKEEEKRQQQLRECQTKIDNLVHQYQSKQLRH